MKLWLKIIIIIAVLSLVGGGIFGIVKLADDGKFDSKRISPLSFSVGGLDGKGKYMNTDHSIYTKDAFECQGLNCTLVFDNSISYQIYFYDQNNEFVHTTGRLTGAFVQDSVPFFAKYARIVIVPNDDEKVSRLEVTKYAKQLKTTVYREQGFKNFTENLLVVEKTGYKFDYNTGADTAEPEMDLSNYINVTSYNEVLIFRDDADVGLRVAGFYNADRSFSSIHGNVSSLATLSFTTSEGVKYYSIDLSSLDEGISYLRLCWDNTHHAPAVYCR